MKFRNGFVSNSSSSSFIVCVPESFTQKDFDKLATLDKLEKDYKGEYGYTIFSSFGAETQKEKKEIQEKLKNAFALVKKEEYVTEWSFYEKNGKEKQVGNVGIDISKILQSQDMVLMELGDGPSMGSVRNICTPENIKKFKKLL